ncbi:hypothetical protein [Deinococcus ruber]|uniref:hypothetical protein n=1 Tax=Deinococcus ruber TaxID=1848197 RepID=UPI001665813D|nr:hypothetical protein [Deinococcus ruber]
MVAAITATTEVLSPCGHEVLRFDQSRGFAYLASHGSSRYPRSRLCPQCFVPPTFHSLQLVSGSDQVASDWGSLTLQQRLAALPVLFALREHHPTMPDPEHWHELTAQERRAVAEIGEQFTQALGLTFREYLLRRTHPAPTITPAGYRRLKASEPEKERRRRKNDHRLPLP